MTRAEINQPVPFNFNFRAWYILWSPVSGGACALQQEAEWLLITLYLVPRALHPSSIRHTRTADIRGGLPGRTGSHYCWTWRYDLRGCFRNRCAPAFDIVTVEGEGCSAAGWEEMSEGDSGLKTDGISADVGICPCFFVDRCFKLIQYSTIMILPKFVKTFWQRTTTDNLLF